MQQEHLAGGVRGIEPEEVRIRKAFLQRGTAAADLAQEAAVVVEMAARLGENPPHDLESVGAGCKRKARLMTAFSGKACHACGIDVRRGAQDDVGQAVAYRRERIASKEVHAVADLMLLHVDCRNLECML